MNNNYQIVTVFNQDEYAEGNQALIIYDDHFSDLNDQFIMAERKQFFNNTQNKSITTLCFVSLENENNINLRCFTASHKIQCCGHGMIAAAKIIFTKTKLNHVSINDEVFAQDDKENEKIILNLPRINSVVESIPLWTKAIFRLNRKFIEPYYVACSDEEDGYLLIELSTLLTRKDFSELEIDFDSICKNTKRAIVVIIFDENSQQLLMRYFAPQYGSAEDTATGSVMRFVADYIAAQYKHTKYRVIQCSQKGGYMEIDCNIDSVMIKANALLESSER